ncbi:hypothetical protein COV15_00765 [Candidatus Woesearchaeota archaeon CG10_big_fil_rev_8_21_14_0_10_34_12]|nr:MAG: hypothetical protein COV15_00765 [Candidatus Woesearchaeota archaeon CG10_big_fil_rev_8_21_14_0_10_34_12]
MRFFDKITNIILLINVVFFILASILLVLNLDFIQYIALQPAAALQGKNLWTLVTSMFMHANFTHLAVNMISLFFLGSFVEKVIGKKRFLFFYLLSGIFAGIFFVLIAGTFNFDLNTYAVGASGALFGLAGLLAVLLPKLKVLVFFIIPMPMWAAVFFLLAVLWLISLSAGIPIGNTAHLGGLILGLVYGFYLRKKYSRKINMLNRMLG